MLHPLLRAAAALVMVLVASHAAPARPALSGGPLDGLWLVKVNNWEHPGTGEKPIVDKGLILLSIVDSNSGPNSSLTASFLDDNGIVNLTGRRCGKAFALFVDGEETLMVSGKGAINAKGICNSLNGAATSISEEAVTFTKFTGKRPPL
jgi:hypothetical protein